MRELKYPLSVYSESFYKWTTIFIMEINAELDYQEKTFFRNLEIKLL